MWRKDSEMPMIHNLDGTLAACKSIYQKKLWKYKKTSDWNPQNFLNYSSIKPFNTFRTQHPVMFPSVFYLLKDDPKTWHWQAGRFPPQNNPRLIGGVQFREKSSLLAEIISQGRTGFLNRLKFLSCFYDFLASSKPWSSRENTSLYWENISYPTSCLLTRMSRHEALYMHLRRDPLRKCSYEQISGCVSTDNT